MDRRAAANSGAHMSPAVSSDGRARRLSVDPTFAVSCACGRGPSALPDRSSIARRLVSMARCSVARHETCVPPQRRDEVGLFLVRMGGFRLQNGQEKNGKALPAWRRRGLLQEPVRSGRKGKWEGQRRGTYFAANNPNRFISVLVARRWLGVSILADQAVAGSSCASRISPWGQLLFPKGHLRGLESLELTSHLCSFLSTSYQLALTTSVLFASRPSAPAPPPSTLEAPAQFPPGGLRIASASYLKSLDPRAASRTPPFYWPPGTVAVAAVTFTE